MENTNLSFMGGFNAAEHEDVRDDSPIPEGNYYLQLESAELKDTSSGEGRGLNATFEVLGQVETQACAGRKVFNWFNLMHSNEVAQKIGQAEFASLCKAVGVLTPKSTDELIGKPFIAKIGFDKKDKSKNVIKKYLPIDGAPTQQSTSAPAPAPASSSTSKPTPPWMRK